MDKKYSPNSDDNKQIDSKKIATELEALHAKINALSSLMEVSIIISSTLDLDELMFLVMEKAQKVMKAEASSVMIINEEKQILECPIALGEVGEKIKKIELPIDKGIAGWVAQKGEPQNIPDAYQDSRFNPKVDEETGFRTRSILAAPLKVKGKTIGVAEVINRLDGKAFDKDDLELFSTFCRQVAMAIQNARIHHLELERQKIEHQLETAKFIQQSFMPDGFPVSSGQQFEVAAKTLEATSVGGDFFDFFEFDNKTVGFTIGDVCGKGIPAALFMARMVSDYRLYSQLYDNPAEVLGALNKVLVKRSFRGMFVTSIYGVLKPSEGKFVFSSAGHLPVIKINGKNNQIELINNYKGIPLGIMPDFNFEQGFLELQKNDLIVLITDGVIEAKNKAGQIYSLERVLDVLANPKAKVQEMVDLLLEDIQKFSEDTLQHDDLTIVMIKWK
jgi:sigma-B regulation protein RsbU (phosphoserine phosphatase)